MHILDTYKHTYEVKMNITGLVQANMLPCHDGPLRRCFGATHHQAACVERQPAESLG